MLWGDYFVVPLAPSTDLTSENAQGGVLSTHVCAPGAFSRGYAAVRDDLASHRYYCNEHLICCVSHTRLAQNKRSEPGEELRLGC